MKKQNFVKAIWKIINYTFRMVTRMSAIIAVVSAMFWAYAYRVGIGTTEFKIVFFVCLGWFSLVGVLAWLEKEYNI